ncbi:Oligopeptide transport ATP-binding protein OppD [Paramixta manurensis]|uniref:ABC-type dipeptide transporter n=1 Tax=Paramixta manurensis TaxID=2740817 RepID=A0A6M8U8B0_9GAMM|nr:Oligopeptide transport ATP-binding protein OppD [Erwiniaceae bacterium PD-1]
MTSTPLLQVEGLCIDFMQRRGALRAISDVSLTLNPGELLGMVGESGAGKSLTGSAITGLLEHPGHISHGQIHFKGQRIDRLDERQRRALRGREIGSIFQDPLTSLNPVITVGEQLIETIRTHLPLNEKQARQHAVRLLAEVGINSPEQRMAQYPHQFSGGMRQRIIIALVLCVSPSLVIADEPTTALDVSVQAQVLGLLKRLCKQSQTAVMLITHDMGVIAEICDRVAVMYAGRLVEIGPVNQILMHPQHPYTQGLMASIPSLHQREARLRQIEGAMPRLNQLPQGCAFHPRCPHGSLQCRQQIPALKPVGEVQVACLQCEEEESR